MKNVDNVNLNTLEPNEDDPIFGWKDPATGKNYWLKDDEGFFLVAQMDAESIVEVIPHPIETPFAPKANMPEVTA